MGCSCTCVGNCSTSLRQESEILSITELLENCSPWASSRYAYTGSRFTCKGKAAKQAQSQHTTSKCFTGNNHLNNLPVLRDAKRLWIHGIVEEGLGNLMLHHLLENLWQALCQYSLSRTGKLSL